jgi:predicted O-methyltransferase YrrM
MPGVARPDATIVAVDLPGVQGDVPADETWLRAHARPGQAIHIVSGDSHDHDVLERVRRAAPEFDVAFIDGDHSYEGVKADYETYAPLVRPGGLVALHDIVETSLPPQTTGGAIEVPRFWRELGSEVRQREFICKSDDRGWGGRWGGIGVVFR